MSDALPSIDRWDHLSGQRVLVRVDFNVPVADLDGVAKVVDDFRLRSALPLFEALLARGAEVVVATHLGRPRGVVDERCRVEPLRRCLAALCPEVELLENLRFNPGEEANDPQYGASLVEGFQYYVNEAFGASHRAHASIMIPPSLRPSAGGPNLHREVATIVSLLDAPQRPFVAVVGGAKARDKLGLLRVLVEKADVVIVGGAMAHTFAVAEGRSVGESFFDSAYVEQCAALLEGGNVLVPVDSRGLARDAAFGPLGGDDEAIDFSENIPEGFVGLDIGSSSVEVFAEVIAGAATVLWNGPMGVFEDPRFGRGTEALARAIASSPAVSVVGGGDSVAALTSYGLKDDVSFVSTGGGASLELVELGDLPGLRALRESPWN